MPRQVKAICGGRGEIPGWAAVDRLVVLECNIDEDASMWSDLIVIVLVIGDSFCEVEQEIEIELPDNRRK